MMCSYILACRVQRFLRRFCFGSSAKADSTPMQLRVRLRFRRLVLRGLTSWCAGSWLQKWLGSTQTSNVVLALAEVVLCTAVVWAV